jgi:hypothetical protein
LAARVDTVARALMTFWGVTAWVETGRKTEYFANPFLIAVLIKTELQSLEREQVTSYN